jgi:hypothetical protein
MKIFDENLLAEIAKDTGTSKELREEDTDFLKCLEKMAEEVKDEADSID